jgi:transcriptional regulator with XRE-family HTH domain
MEPTLEARTSKVLSKLRAKELAKNDYLLVRDLIQLRIDSELSQKDVAEKLGISQQAVSKFEKLDADPRLSTIRLYAHAIGALVAHVVEKDNGQLLSMGDGWVRARFETHVSSTSLPDFTSVPATFTSKISDFSLAA